MYLFSVPGGNQDSTVGSPALLVKSAKATGDLIQGDGSRCGIGGSQNLHNSGQLSIWTRDRGHTQAVLPSENNDGQIGGKHTITVIPDNNNFALDATRDIGHRVPNRGDLLINYRYSGSGRTEIGECFTMVDEPDYSVGPASLNFFEQYLCVGPRNRQAGDGGYVFSLGAIRVLI